MTKKRPLSSPYPSFDAIGADPVHLRLKGDSVTDPIVYANAELDSVATGKPGRMSAQFRMERSGERVEVFETNYTAWTRY
jgi:hypothetical protein